MNILQGKKKGFTLIELIVCLAIIGIVGVFLATFLTPQMNSYQLAVEQTKAQTASSSLVNIIREELRYAKNITVSANSIAYTKVTKESEQAKTLDGEALGQEFFPEYAKKGKKIALSFEKASSVITVTCTITDQKNNILFQNKQSIEALNETLPSDEA